MPLMPWPPSRTGRELSESRPRWMATTASNCWFGTLVSGWIRVASRSCSKRSTPPRRMAWASVSPSAVRSSRVTRENCGQWPTTGRARHSVSPSLAPPATRPTQLLNRPWINDVNAAVLKVLHIARCETRASGTRHCDNHGIELADWFTRRSPRRGDFRVHVRSIAVETQDLMGEICINNLLCGIPQSAAALTVGNQTNAVENFALSYGSNE